MLLSLFCVSTVIVSIPFGNDCVTVLSEMSLCTVLMYFKETVQYIVLLTKSVTNYYTIESWD